MADGYANEMTGVIVIESIAIEQIKELRFSGNLVKDFKNYRDY